MNRLQWNRYNFSPCRLTSQPLCLEQVNLLVWDTSGQTLLKWSFLLSWSLNSEPIWTKSTAFRSDCHRFANPSVHLKFFREPKMLKYCTLKRHNASTFNTCFVQRSVNAWLRFPFKFVWLINCTSISNKALFRRHNPVGVGTGNSYVEATIYPDSDHQLLFVVPLNTGLDIHHFHFCCLIAVVSDVACTIMFKIKVCCCKKIRLKNGKW